jgi:predicted ATPase
MEHRCFACLLSAGRRTFSVASRYDALLASRSIAEDAPQRAALAPLDSSLRGLRAFSRARAAARARLALQPPAPPPSGEHDDGPFSPPADVAAVGSLPRGVYLHGGVGTGKSMLMDLFFCAARGGDGGGGGDGGAPALRARRVHFHAFMLEVQQRLHAARLAAPPPPAGAFRGHVDLRPGRDAAARVGAALAREVDVLCLDELQVTDVADALVVARLFRALLAGGAALVATSNRRPCELYEGGLNREHFLPFVALLERHTAVVEVGGGGSGGGGDHRARLGGGGRAAALSWPCGPAADAALCAAAGWPPPGSAGCPLDGGGGGGAPLAALPVAMGRSLSLREPSPGRFLADFGALCGAPLGAADYGALAARARLLALRGVPVFSAGRADEARRFVTLVDELYEARVALVATAAAPAAALFDLRAAAAAGGGGGGTEAAAAGGRDALVPSAAAEDAAMRELAFAARRCVSRLVEMGGAAWARRALEGAAPAAAGGNK